MDYPISLYYDTDVADIKTLDLCRGDDDYRKVYIVKDGKHHLVIKHLSNTFSDGRRINGWFRLMEGYRKIGIYCPAVVKNRFGELLHRETTDGRDYYVYAEEFAAYETAENIAPERYKDEFGHCSFTPDVMRSLGKAAAAKFDFLDWGSAVLSP